MESTFFLKCLSIRKPMYTRLFFILHTIILLSCNNKSEKSFDNKLNVDTYNKQAGPALSFEGIAPENPLMLLNYSEVTRVHIKDKVQKIELDQGLYEFYGHPIYLANGFDVTVTFTPDDKNTPYRIRGRGARANRILASMIQQTEAFISNEIVFGDLLLQPIHRFWERLQLFSEKLEDMLSGTTLDQKFAEDQRKNIHYICKFIAYSYEKYYSGNSDKNPKNQLKIHQLSLKDKKALNDFIFKDVNFNDSYLFKNVLYYRKLLKSIYSQKIKALYKGSVSTSEHFQAILNAIDQTFKDKEIKEYFWYKEMSLYMLFGSKSFLSEAYYIYKKHAGNSSFIESIDKLYLQTATGYETRRPPEFSFKDIYGKEFHLNNFKGSYVFINVWATWCKICLEDFPLLEEIQEKYRSKPIKFVNISVDKQSNKVSWKEFLLNNKYNGIHLISDQDFDSTFLRFFKVKRLPRFIILDKEGKVLESDAPMLTDKALHELLSSLK